MRKDDGGRFDRLSYYSYDSYGHTPADTKRMIKVDIVNEVSRVADITKVKAEVAVDAVFDAMRVSMQRGDRIELRGFGVFQVKPRKPKSRLPSRSWAVPTWASPRCSTNCSARSAP